MTDSVVNNIKVHTNFSGAILGQTKIDGNKLFTSIKDEEITTADGYSHDYAYHFAFAIENVSENEQEIEVFIGCRSSELIPEIQPNIFYSDSLENDFQPLTTPAKTDTYKQYYFRVKMRGSSILYLANSYFRTYERQLTIFRELARKSNVSSEIIGESLEGRPLTSYIFGSDNENIHNEKLEKPVIIVTSGFHFPEQDTLGTESIFEYLSQEEGKQLSKQFTIVLIPILNPDGFFHGFNGCNAAGINFHWKFDPKDTVNTPEAGHIWNYFSKLRPVVFLDFHAYTFQLSRKKASPYIKPLFLYKNTEVRNIVQELHSQVISLTNGNFVKGAGAFLPSTLGSQLMKEFNTITLAKFHLHISDGIKESKDLAVNVMRVVMKTLRRHGIVEPEQILKKPYGNVKNGRLGEAILNFRWWGFLKLYPIKNFSRSKLGIIKKRLLELF